MDKSKIKDLEKKLIDIKKGREKSLAEEHLGLGESIKDNTSELSSYDNHPGDIGTETFEAEKNFSFRNNDKFVIGEANDALKKIEDGSYGFCEHCGEEIAEERLDILPYARLCISCENEFKFKTDDEEKGRPIEEQILTPPFGRSFKDNSLEDSVMFDGEDAWQDVNVYNDVTSDNPFSKDDSMGYVEDVESISNEQYKKQLE
ncbi:TraR/DksA C4-type zinc finger protein [Lutispora sp.]|uniref:TraR/DksA C4-type zinc finger protein n=1 Tax=Lutispora sp. TaxID=2828727 RepID=UPI000EDD8583|nr:TraR/DksA C4-type zinc finger protein [Lutispora sp.]MEA4962037.1 TraR/DksA C4-type zinc finger protein [Lutispora sp.]HCJ57002.1 molecular chaperone DnaK [Clostridiaceae bacterium]